LQILRFNLFKKHVKEPKKPNPVTMHIDIMKMLEMLRDVLAAIFVKLWRYFRVRVKRFHITVATDDAAKTAMMYGAVCGFGDEIFAILEKALDFGVEKGALVGAECDYLSEEMKMDIEIDISITVGNVFRYLFGIVGAALAGVLHGIHIKVNKEFFSHNKKYKKDVVEYNKHKTLLKAYEEAQAAKKEARKKKAAEKAAKKAEKKRLKAAKKAEAQEASAAENNENKNEYLKTETSERDNTNVSE
jgi:hypothetical protein